MSALPISLWIEQARRDDWHTTFAGSDIRQMLSEIIRLQALNDGMLEELEVIAAGDVDVSNTAIIVGNGASTVMEQVRDALAKARGQS